MKWNFELLIPFFQALSRQLKKKFKMGQRNVSKIWMSVFLVSYLKMILK